MSYENSHDYDVFPVAHCYSTSGAGIRTPDTRIMIPNKRIGVSCYTPTQISAQLRIEAKSISTF
jgi:hypothetical protein